MVINKRPLYGFFDILLLLQLEDMLRTWRSPMETSECVYRHPYLVKLLLQFLISIINAELLKAVLLKHLKTIDIQDTDGGVALVM